MTTDKLDVQLAQVWDQFCEKLKPAKQIVFRESAPAAGRDRAAGIRMLARNLSMALDKELENADPLHPQLTISWTGAASRAATTPIRFTSPRRSTVPTPTA